MLKFEKKVRRQKVNIYPARGEKQPLHGVGSYIDSASLYKSVFFHTAVSKMYRPIVLLTEIKCEIH